METADYLDVFIDESNEHIQVLYDQLMALEKNKDDKSIIDEIFRAAHTLKGMSATMGFSKLADLTHKMENVFDAIKNGRISVDTQTVDIMFTAVDHLNEMTKDIASGGKGGADIEQIASRLQEIENGKELQPNSYSEEEKSVYTSVFGQPLDEFELTVVNEAADRGFLSFEITIALRKDCLLKAARVVMVFEVLEGLGEVIKSVPSVSELEEENFNQRFSLLFVSPAGKDKIKQKIEKVSEIESVTVIPFMPNQYKRKQEQTEVPSISKKGREQQKSQKQKGPSLKNKTIRVHIKKLDVLMNLFEELVIDKGRLQLISNEMNHKDLKDTVEHMSRISDDLQDIILAMRMVPIDKVFSRFPPMIRQLARDLGKNVTIDIQGAETELDRTVIDKIGDPLVHLIRNALDHGIEQPGERTAKGKQEQGTIKLKAHHSGNHVFIQISDDGAGINKDKVLKKAMANRVVDEEQARSLNDSQVFELLMESGFSTAENVSDISGRGVGLDAVRTTIESLGGSITVNAEEGKGSVFSIQLPLTLTIVSVLLVELQNEKYAVPLSSIIEAAIMHKDQIKSLHTKKVMDFRGKMVPLIFLNDIFSVPEKEHGESEFVSVIIVKKEDKMAGLVVDSLISQQEVVLKPLGNYLNRTFAISGATILGDGEIALIIDSNALMA